MKDGCKFPSPLESGLIKVKHFCFLFIFSFSQPICFFPSDMFSTAEPCYKYISTVPAGSIISLHMIPHYFPVQLTKELSRFVLFQFFTFYPILIPLKITNIPIISLKNALEHGTSVLSYYYIH